MSILIGQNAVRHVVAENNLGRSRLKNKMVAKPVIKNPWKEIAKKKSAQVSGL